MKTYNSEPTLTDTQVLEFCRDGFMMLKGVVPEEINKQTFEFLDLHPHGKPVEILKEDWFVENVILNSQAVGIVRSLLGKNFALATRIANHRAECPGPAQHWHRDGGSIHSPEMDSLQVFYYPQDTPLELGPTQVVPGSHLLFSLQSHMRHYGSIRVAHSAVAPAGSIFITMYSIWHRRGPSTSHGTRNLLKYWYRRTVPPERDWVIEQEFNLQQAYHFSHGITFNREGHKTINDAAEIYFWLCGKHDQYRARTNNLPVYFS